MPLVFSDAVGIYSVGTIFTIEASQRTEDSGGYNNNNISDDIAEGLKKL